MHELTGGAVRAGINWTEVGLSWHFEKIVSILLSTLHPDSERIDELAGTVAGPPAIC